MPLNLNNFATQQILVTGFTLLQMVSASNAGGLDDNTVNTATKATSPTTVAAAAAAAGTAAGAAPTTAIEVATTQAATHTVTEGTATRVTYNQWGFTGDQSIWQPPTLATSATGSKSVSSSLGIPTIKNSTSNANRLQSNIAFQGDYTWKKTFLVGSIVGLTAILHAL